MGFGKHKHTGMDKTISGGGGYEGIYFCARENMFPEIEIKPSKSPRPVPYYDVCVGGGGRKGVTSSIRVLCGVGGVI
jgi:hypothetical protein